MVPIEFLRQFRLFDYAIFDFVVVFVAVLVLAPYLSKLFKKIRLEIPKKNWLFLALPIGILVHLIVGNVTPMTRDFIDLQGYYLLKLIIMVLAVWGMRGVRVISRK